jgi:hypothetical protein
LRNLDLAAGARLLDRRVVITALGIAQILTWGTSFYFPAVLFAEPIVAETGWSLGFVARRHVYRLAHRRSDLPIGRSRDRYPRRTACADGKFVILRGGPRARRLFTGAADFSGGMG